MNIRDIEGYKNKVINQTTVWSALKLLSKLDVKKVYIAGMDGYSDENTISYADKKLEYDFSSIAQERNRLISQELLKNN